MRRTLALRGPALALGLALALAACGDAGSPRNNVTQIHTANPFNEKLKGGNDLYRNLGLRTAILDSHQKCKRAERASYQEDYKNMAMWTAHCIDSGDWAIFISPGGEAQVRPCGDLPGLGLPACRMAAAAGPEAPGGKAKARPR